MPDARASWHRSRRIRVTRLGPPSASPCRPSACPDARDRRRRPRISPTIRPSYRTISRSDRARSSSRSSETSRIALPAARRASSSERTYSVAPTSSPRVGCDTTMTRGSRDSTRASRTFWILPPDSVADAVVGSRADREALDELVRMGSDPRARRVVPSRRSRRSARARGSARPTAPERARHVGPPGCGPTPAAMTRRRRRAGEFDAVDEDRPARRAGACRPARRRARVWPLPETPATPRISPARDLERDAPDARRRQSPATRSSRTRRTASRVVASASSWSARSTPNIGRPTIIRASSRSSVVPGAVPINAPFRSTLTRSVIVRTSASLWLMKTTASPSATRRRSVANRASTSCGTSTAVGSSRMRTRQSRASAFTISTRCCSPIDRSPTRARGSTLMPYRAEASATCLRAAASSSRKPVPTEREILGDRHRPDEREVLGHHPDPGGDRDARRGHRDGAAVDADLARVGSGQPIQDAHQRRLAGAVLPEKGMDLPAADREIDPVVGNEAPEPLGDPPELDDRLRVRRDHFGVSWRGRSPRAGLPR